MPSGRISPSRLGNPHPTRWARANAPRVTQKRNKEGAVLGATFAPSTPAVRFPWLSCVTRRTAKQRAASDFMRSLCTLWTASTLPRSEARKIRRCRRYTTRSSLRHGRVAQSSIGTCSVTIASVTSCSWSPYLPDCRADVSLSRALPLAFASSAILLSDGMRFGHLLLVSTAQKSLSESSFVPLMRLTPP